MRFSEKIRSSTYWSLDSLKGREVGKHFEEIRNILENQNTSENEQYNEVNLLKILRHATDTTPFYSDFRNFNSIDEFPVINKTVIKSRAECFLSSVHLGEKLHKVTTSGSTGAPLAVLQDSVKRARHQAENIYFSEIAGYPIGSKLYYLRVWNEINRKNFLERVIQNIVMYKANDLSDRSLKFLIEKLISDKSKKSLLAFSSTYEALSHYVDTLPHPLPITINTIITMSETLPEGAKKILKKAFNCPVISRYSNMENGFMAQQCREENNEYHINTASFFIELFDPEKDEPVGFGKPGRIIVTDLFNFAMPMIRYDTGDMAIMAEKSVCGKPGPVFTRIEGRKVDFIFDTMGNLLSPHVVTNTMWKFSASVRQFQFIQNGPVDYLVKLNCLESEFNRKVELLKDLEYYLGEDANIGLEFVDEIPLLASGKRKKIVNNYNQG